MFMRLKKLRSRRFYITLIFSYIVILFLSLMCAALGYRHLYKNVREQTLEQISLQLKQATYITEGYIESVKNSLLALTMSPQAQAFAYIDKLSNADDFYQLMQMTQMITGISAGNTSLSCLLMYAEGIDSVIYSTSRMDRTEYFQTNLRFAGMNEDTWKEEISQTGYLKTLPVHMNEQTGQKLIGFISSIPLVSPHGTVIAYLDEALLGKAFAAGGLTQEGSILILSNNEPICTIGAENWFRREDGSYAYDEDGGSMLSLSVRGNDWTYAYAIPNETVTSKMQPTRIFIMQMLILEFCSVGLFSIAVARANYSPLKRLLSKLAFFRQECEYESECDRIFNVTADILSNNKIMAERLKNQLPLIQNGILQQLLRASGPTSRETLDEYGISFPMPFFTVLLFTIPQTIESDKGAMISCSLRNALEDHLRSKYCCRLVCCAEGTIAVILNDQRDCAQNVGEEIIRFLETTFSYNACLGCGETVSTIEKIAMSFEQAQEALEYAHARGKGGVTRFVDLKYEPSLYILSQTQEQELTRYICAGEEKKVSMLIKKMFSDVSNEPLIHLQLMSYGIVTVFLHILSDWKMSADVQEELDNLSIQILHNASPEYLCRELCIFAQQLTAVSIQLKQGNLAEIGENMQRIITERYSDSTLSLTVIAQTLNMNASYLSHVFKQQTGQSFINALSQMRLNKARGLLIATDLAVSTVAEQCGYASASYFIRVFKKQFGQTPSQFRTDIENRM